MASSPVRSRLGLLALLALGVALIVGLMVPMNAGAIEMGPPVSGTITDSTTGDPIYDAAVFIYEQVGGVGDYNLVTWQPTNESGFYQWWEPVPGNGYSISVDAYGFVPTPHPSAYSFSGWSPITMDLAVDPIVDQGRVFGIVTDDSMNPVWDASIDVFRWNVAELDYTLWSDTIWLDELGAYDVMLPFGTYKLVADAYAYSPDVTMVTVDSSDVSADFVIQSTPLCISGQVTDTDTGAPIDYPNVSLSRYDVEGSYWDEVAWARTDIGTYEFYEIEPDEYMITAEADGYIQTSDVIDFTGEYLKLDLQMKLRPVVAKGQVTDTATKKPIEGATAFLEIWDTEYDDWSIVDAMSTYADGRYKLTGLGNGTYRMVFDHAKYTAVTKPSFVFGGTPRVVNAAMAPAALSITASIEDSLDAAPIEGAEVDLLEYVVEHDEYWNYAWGDDSDADGLARFYKVPAGTYRLEAWANGYNWGAGNDFDFSGTPLTETLALDKLATAVSGTVTDVGTGDPIANATVDLQVNWFGDWETWETRETNAAGEYEFYDDSVWLDENYRFVAQAKDYDPEPSAEYLYEGTPLTVDFTLSLAPVAVSGKVADAATSAALSGATASLYQYEPGMEEWWQIDAVSTAADGTYQFRRTLLPTESYKIGVEDHVYLPGESATFTSADAPVVRNVALTKGTKSLYGVVKDLGTGLPIKGAFVWIEYYDSEAEEWWTVDVVSTGVDGAYDFYKLEPGTQYRVGANSDLYAPLIQPSEWAFTAGATAIKHDIGIGVPPTTSGLLAGANRYDVAINLSSQLRVKRGTPFTDVIVACGEDRAMADPLGAAALAGAYDCPVLLTPTARANAGTLATIKAMRDANGGKLNIHVVGGAASVPKTVYNAIAALKGTGTCERIDAANRYALAQKMAARVKTVMEGKGTPVDKVMVVNIEDAKSFSDALSASTIAASAHMPLIGVRGSSVPGEASAALSLFPTAKRYAVNSAYLAAGVRSATKCEASPMASSGNREVAATQIAQFGVNNGFVSYQNVGLVNKLSDALPAGALIGRLGGILVYTNTSPLSPTTSAFVTSIKAEVEKGWVFGGDATIAPATRTQFQNCLK